MAAASMCTLPRRYVTRKSTKTRNTFFALFQQTNRQFIDSGGTVVKGCYFYASPCFKGLIKYLLCFLLISFVVISKLRISKCIGDYFLKQSGVRANIYAILPPSLQRISITITWDCCIKIDVDCCSSFIVIKQTA